MKDTDLPDRSLLSGKREASHDYERQRADRINKYWHYLFVIAVLTVFVSFLALVNGYFHLVNISPYRTAGKGLPAGFLLTGYLGMFLTMVFSPVPDYFLIPAFGYLSMVGMFNPYYTFLVCVLGALFPIEYVCGRFAARPLLLKALSFFRISEKTLETTDKWLADHGRFSILISTFIPFFYSVASLAAGTLKMRATEFILFSTAGFAVRYAFLELIGYYGIYVFASSFDYSQRTMFFMLLGLSSIYVAIHFVRILAPNSNKLKKIPV